MCRPNALFSRVLVVRIEVMAELETTLRLVWVLFGALLREKFLSHKHVVNSF
jgi:hypothetical protein